MIEKLYLDMDGVLCNFEEKFAGHYGPISLGKRNRKEWSEDWRDFILNKKGFENLDWFPGAHALLEYVEKLGIPVEILSSTGGQKFHEEVAVQKTNWLKSHGIKYKANFVWNRKKKAEYATPRTILIDDTDDVIRAFKSAGGIGILHRKDHETIENLRSLVTKE
jgi:hypothetical protein